MVDTDETTTQMSAPMVAPAEPAASAAPDPAETAPVALLQFVVKLLILRDEDTI